jgi:hypothetical protein
MRLEREVKLGFSMADFAIALLCSLLTYGMQ